MPQPLSQPRLQLQDLVHQPILWPGHMLVKPAPLAGAGASANGRLCSLAPRNDAAPRAGSHPHLSRVRVGYDRVEERPVRGGRLRGGGISRTRKARLRSSRLALLDCAMAACLPGTVGAVIIGLLSSARRAGLPCHSARPARPSVLGTISSVLSRRRVSRGSKPAAAL